MIAGAPVPPWPASRGEALVHRLRAGVIGNGQMLPGPYGPRPITYADHTATGRAVDLVEGAIRDHVLPWYANTHSESSALAAATTRLREQARRVIHDSVGGTDEHVVVFCGSGSTAAIHKLAMMLGLGPGAERRVRSRSAGGRPVVLLGPHEHHSNELPWRESVADVVAIPATHDDRVDLAALEAELRRHCGRRHVVGSFSAASNVTGAIADTDAISALLHAHGALACWDYAAAGPYLPIRMDASGPGRRDHKDAVFLSPHKFLGGPQTPGVLVARRSLFRNAVPTVPGGGAVTYVNTEGHWYSDDPVIREEAGTPAIVESIRAGMAFALKDAVGTDLIGAIDGRYSWRALRQWGRNPSIELLGNPTVPRLPIVSFRLRHGARYLHHHFVVAVLSDLFGIQARGGCSCAGPYGHRLLSIDGARSRSIQAEVAQGRSGIKPGWTRITLHYAMSEAIVEYIIDAVDVIARYGHRLLPDYRFDPYSGHWRHHTHEHRQEIDLLELLATAPSSGRDAVDPQAMPGYLERARELLTGRADPLDGPTGLPAGFEALRDFHLPPVCLGRTDVPEGRLTSV